MSNSDFDDAADDIPASLRDASKGHLDGRATVAVEGETASFIADRQVVCMMTTGRVGRVVQCVRLAEVSAVAADARPDGVLVQIVLADGHRYAVTVPEAGTEAAMQAATVLNLLAAQARRDEPVGQGIAAQRPNWRERLRNRQSR